MTASYVDRQIEFYRSKGAEFLGAWVQLRTNVSQKITLQDIRDIFLNSPLLEDKWAPQAHSDLKLYLSTMVEIGRSSRLDKLEPERDDTGRVIRAVNKDIDPEKHSRFVVERLHLARDDDRPAAHMILHMEKTYEDVPQPDGTIIKRQVAVEADEGIKVVLHRKKGDKDTDVTGGSAWKFEVFKADGTPFANRDEIPRRYHPFLRAVARDWRKKRNKVYTTKEVREIVLDVIVNKMRLDSVDRAIYFAPPEKIDMLRDLRDRLKQLDDGVRLWINEVPKYPDKEENDMADMTSLGLVDNLSKQLKTLLDEVRERTDDDDTSTRDSTWLKRRTELYEIRDKIRHYNRLKLMSEDILKEQFKECAALIEEHV